MTIIWCLLRREPHSFTVYLHFSVICIFRLRIRTTSTFKLCKRNCYPTRLCQIPKYTVPFKANSHIPCRSPATTLPFSGSAVSFVKVPYLVHEVLLLSPSRNYRLLNCYHSLCAVNFQALMSLHQDNKLLLVHDKRWFVSHWPPVSDWYASDNKLPGNGRGSSKRPKAGKTPTCRLMPSPCHGLEKSLSERHIRGMGAACYVWIKHGHTV
jgi:hypothetical protein